MLFSSQSQVRPRELGRRQYSTVVLTPFTLFLCFSRFLFFHFKTFPPTHFHSQTSVCQTGTTTSVLMALLFLVHREWGRKISLSMRKNKRIDSWSGRVLRHSSKKRCQIHWCLEEWERISLNIKQKNGKSMRSRNDILCNNNVILLFANLDSKERENPWKKQELKKNLYQRTPSNEIWQKQTPTGGWCLLFHENQTTRWDEKKRIKAVVLFVVDDGKKETTTRVLSSSSSQQKNKATGKKFGKQNCNPSDVWV